METLMYCLGAVWGVLCHPVVQQSCFVLMACSPVIYMLLEAQTKRQKLLVLTICAVAAIGVMQLKEVGALVQVNNLNNYGEQIQ